MKLFGEISAQKVLDDVTKESTNKAERLKQRANRIQSIAMD